MPKEKVEEKKLVAEKKTKNLNEQS